MPIELKSLFAEFPRSAISWRAQSLTREGDKAMALAYIDARDVMNRLDDVCGVDGWQCKYSHANGKTICDIGVKCGEEWVWKADGAGDTDIEAEKGAISDAFKRAAVKWGIGRYLYDLPAPWVPCESREFNGKKQFVKFKDDPWKHVKTSPVAKDVYGTHDAMKKKFNEIKGQLEEAADFEDLKLIWKAENSHILAMKHINEATYDELVKIKDNRKKQIADRKAQEASFPQDFNNITARQQ